jgi:hypothetical protein
MDAVSLARVLLCAGLACGSAGAAFAQQGIRHEPDSWRGSGLRLDPAALPLASGWGASFEFLRSGRYEPAPRYSLLGARGEPDWRSPGYRLQWSYDFGARGSFGLSLASGRHPEDFIGQEFAAGRQLSLYGRYWFSPDWALSAEALAPAGQLLQRPTIRLGVQRQF